MNNNCEFCDEIHGVGDTRFEKIYGNALRNRIVDSTSNYVALPTLGQLFEGSLLILPKAHEETFACLSENLQLEALEFVNRIERVVGRYGHVLIFEHGARSCTGGGCGIYHAHMHAVPVPKPVEVVDFVGSSGHPADDFMQAWSELKDCCEYFVMKDGAGNISYFRCDSLSRPFESQFSRRRIVEYFGLRLPWNWRDYSFVEPRLLSTVREFSHHLHH